LTDAIEKGAGDEEETVVKPVAKRKAKSDGPKAVEVGMHRDEVESELAQSEAKMDGEQVEGAGEMEDGKEDGTEEDRGTSVTGEKKGGDEDSTEPDSAGSKSHGEQGGPEEAELKGTGDDAVGDGATYEFDFPDWKQDV